MTKISKEHISHLGLTATDKVSNFTGVISLVSFDLYGCVQFVLTPPVDDKGQAIEGRWFDVTRLDIANKKAVIPCPKFNSDEFIAVLGLEAKDTVTGFKGVVSSVGFNLFGHEQFTLTPKTEDNGKCSEGGWFDRSRLKLLSAKPVMDAPDFDKGYVAEGKKGAAIKPLPGQ